MSKFYLVILDDNGEMDDIITDPNKIIKYVDERKTEKTAARAKRNREKRRDI